MSKSTVVDEFQLEMVQNCVDAASTDFGSYNLKKSRDAADVVGSKSSSIHSPVQHHMNTIGSMQPGSVEFVSKVLPLNNHSYTPTLNETVPIESSSLYKTNTNISSSSSSGYESVLSRSSKSHRSLFSRLKRLINFPSSKKSADYPLSTTNPLNDFSTHSPMLMIKQQTTNTSSSGTANSAIDHRRNSLTRLDIRRKSSRRTLAPATQHVPFIYGLKNCGNTCFINAIVQCLCHTEQLAVYILRKGYEIDMRNIKNAITHSSNPLPPIGFKVTKAFVQIFQALWNNSSNTTSKLLYDFKSIIGNLNRQYAGNEQNDAQEFLLFLINTIHDELNLVGHGRCRQQKNKNSFSSVVMSPSSSSSSLSSAELARRAWSEYADANQSIITNIFSAQLHSTLRCNKCKQESKTFEPYLLLSLPIPQKMIKPVFITVVFLNQSPKQLQIGLCLPVMSTVKDVREAIAQQSNLDPNDLALVEIQSNHGFSQVFHDTDLMSRLSQDVYAIQFPSSTSSSNSESLELTNEQNNSLPSTNNHHFVNLLILNRVKTISGRYERFGAPIAVRVPRESNYRALQLSIIKAQRSLLRDEAMEYAQDFVVFQLSLIDHYRSNAGAINKQEYPIHHDVQWPLYLEKIVEILDAYNGQGLGPAHIQVYATWPEKYLGQFIAKYGMSDDKPDIHQSVAQARNALHQPSTSSISLADCFSLFTQSESLNYDDAWMCTHCRRKENGTMKNLKISTTPSVLIIHLKRFCQTKLSNAKLVYPVQFPLIGLDVRRFLATNRNDDSGADDDSHELIEIDEERQHDLYDLFAVCNHRGSMSNGHYTAYCKNPVTHKWYCYDDHLVSEIDSSRVCTPDAYILFYQRRDHSSASIPSVSVPPQAPPTSLLSQSHSSSTPSPQIDSIAQDFDERLLIDEHSPRSTGPVTEEKPISWSSPREKPPVHYVLQPPLPLPRRLFTPISLSPSHEETTPAQSTAAPCPAPRARKTTPIDVEIDPSPILPAQRRLPIAPSSAIPNNYTYTIVDRTNDGFIEPLSEYHPSLSHRYPVTVMEQNNSPWSRYNDHRYSDDEPEVNVFYQTNIVHK